VIWLLFLRLPPRRPLVPRASVVIRELEDDPLADREAFSAAGGRAIRKPVGLRDLFAVVMVSFNASSFLRFDMRGLGGVWKTRVHPSIQVRNAKKE
jgi:hypothetical protein